jgi:hypothetical protein
LQIGHVYIHHQIWQVSPGFIAPGVHFGFDKPPFTMWHSDGIVVVALLDNVPFVLDRVDSLLDDFGADDDLALEVLSVLFAFRGACVVVLCLGCGF